MKIQVRRGVFETNSSSVHSLCICSEDDYDRWKNDKLFYDYCSDELIENSYKVQESRRECAECDGYNTYMTYDEFWDYANKFDETYEKRYTHKSGDDIVVFGYYGFD